MSIVFALAGCADMRNSLFGKAPEPPPCPRVAILPDAQSVTRFAPGAGQDLIDVLYEGKLIDVIGACEHKIDDKKQTGTLSVELQVALEARRGPADRSRLGEYDYFVTLLDSQTKRVLQKNTFRVAASFEGNRTLVQVLDNPVGLTVPLAEGKRGPDFEILIGFQLSRAELDYNRLHEQAR